jgi:hypothetical protein
MPGRRTLRRKTPELVTTVKAMRCEGVVCVIYFVEDDFCNLNLICPAQAPHNLRPTLALNVRNMNTLHGDAIYVYSIYVSCLNFL